MDPIDTQATPVDELNALLVDLTARARDILGSNFVGAYLQGSFALGDADRYSDCDFLVPIRSRPTVEQEVALRALHDEIPTRPGHWAHHLEGSYPDVESLRSLDGLYVEWLYVDHGWREMQWSTHCNSEVVRWTLRERGITLVGPEPHALVDPVPPEALRARMRLTIPTLLEDLASWISLDIAWGQRYAVTTYCRMLYTLVHAEVCSKRAALEWAVRTLDPIWTTLLTRVLADRSRGFDPDDASRPGSVEATVEFGAYCRDLALTW